MTFSQSARRSLGVRLGSGLALFALMLGGWLDCGATTIVALRSDRRVVIAADGMLTISKNGSVVEHRETCKIHRTGDILFAHTGIDWYQPLRPAFTAGVELSLPHALESALSGTGTVREKLVMAERTTRWTLERILSSMRREVPAEFNRRVGTVVLGILFGAIDHGVPVLKTYDYRLDLDGVGGIRISSTAAICPGDCPKVNGMIVVGLGYRDLINDFLPVTRFSEIPTISWTDRLAELVQLEIRAAPEFVGPPVAVLELDTNGIHWYRGMRGACSETLE